MLPWALGFELHFFFVALQDRDAGNSAANAQAAAAAATIAKQVSHGSITKHAHPVAYHSSCCWQAVTRRNDIFKKADVPCLSEVKNARVGLLRHLQVGDYSIVVTEHGFKLRVSITNLPNCIVSLNLKNSIVIAFYSNSKAGEKHGKHS